MGHHTAVTFPLLLWKQSNYFICLLPAPKNLLCLLRHPHYLHVHICTQKILFPLLIFNSLCDAHSEDLILRAELPEAWLHVPLAGQAASTPV